MVNTTPPNRRLEVKSARSVALRTRSHALLHPHFCCPANPLETSLRETVCLFGQQKLHIPRTFYNRRLFEQFFLARLRDMREAVFQIP